MGHGTVCMIIKPWSFDGKSLQFILVGLKRIWNINGDFTPSLTGILPFIFIKLLWIYHHIFPRDLRNCPHTFVNYTNQCLKNQVSSRYPVGSCSDEYAHVIFYLFVLFSVDLSIPSSNFHLDVKTKAKSRREHCSLTMDNGRQTCLHPAKHCSFGWPLCPTGPKQGDIHWSAHVAVVDKTLPYLLFCTLTEFRWEILKYHLPFMSGQTEIGLSSTQFHISNLKTGSTEQVNRVKVFCGLEISWV